MRCLICGMVAVLVVGCGSADVSGSWDGTLMFHLDGDEGRSGSRVVLEVDDAGNVSGLCTDGRCAGMQCASAALEYDAPDLALDAAGNLILRVAGRASGCDEARDFDADFWGSRIR